MKSTASQKRAPDAPPTAAAPSSSEQTKKAKKEIELIITSPTEARELQFGKEGYFLVKDGQILCERYELNKMLGHGTYGAVYLARDKHTDSSVAMKIARSGDLFNKSSDTEIGFMITAKKASEGSSNSVSPIGSNNIVSLIHNFRLGGTHGYHVVMVMELLGPNLYSILHNSNQTMLTLHRIKHFSKNILEGLHFLHLKCRIMHLDLKTENLFVTVDPNNMDLSDPNCTARLKIGDFGISANTNDIVERTVQTSNYRAPESFLKSKITSAADIWSVGCTVYEMATRLLLFPGNEKEYNKKWFLCRISELLGPVKTEYFMRNETNEKIFKEVFGNQESLIEKPLLNNWISSEQLMRDYPMKQSEAEELNGFLKELLVIDPEKRLTAKNALKHSFITNMPEEETEEEIETVIDKQIEEHIRKHAHCYINDYPWASSPSNQSLSKKTSELTKESEGFSSNQGSSFHRGLSPSTHNTHSSYSRTPQSMKNSEPSSSKTSSYSSLHSASQSMKKNEESSSNNAAHSSYNRTPHPMKKNKRGYPSNWERK